MYRLHQHREMMARRKVIRERHAKRIVHERKAAERMCYWVAIATWLIDFKAAMWEWYTREGDFEKAYYDMRESWDITSLQLDESEMVFVVNDPYVGVKTFVRSRSRNGKYDLLHIGWHYLGVNHSDTFGHPVLDVIGVKLDDILDEISDEYGKGYRIL